MNTLPYEPHMPPVPCSGHFKKRDQQLVNAWLSAVNQLPMTQPNFFRCISSKKIQAATKRLRVLKLTEHVPIDLATLKNFLRATRAIGKDIPIAISIPQLSAQPIPISNLVERAAPALHYQACIEIALDDLRIKCLDFRNRGLLTAAEQLHNLLESLSKECHKFFTTQKHLHETFVLNCLSTINCYKPQLQQHRGILGPLDWILGIICILFCVAALRGSHAEALLIKRAEQGCFFFPTTSSQHLQALEEQLNTRSCMPNIQQETSGPL